jgi:pimeloyl-ACP methyl ester carboxylesterase
VTSRPDADAGESTGVVAVDGARLFYRERGSGVPVVLIHGTGANADCWGACFQDLSRDMRLVAYDRRSYSRSTHAPLNSVATHTADLAALLQHLGAVPAVIVGWSFGGLMALRLAASQPELVRSLVLVEPALPWLRCLEPGILRALMGARRNQLRGRPLESVEKFERWAGSHRDGGSSGFDRQPEAARRAQLDNAQSALRELGMMPWQGVSPKSVAAVRCPVTMLVGEQSPPWYQRVARSIQRSLPTTRVIDVPGAGHFVHVDNVGTFSDSIRAAAIDSSAGLSVMTVGDG